MRRTLLTRAERHFISPAPLDARTATLLNSHPPPSHRETGKLAPMDPTAAATLELPSSLHLLLRTSRPSAFHPHRKRDEFERKIHATIANLTVNQHLVRNGLVSHPSLRAQLPPPGSLPNSSPRARAAASYATATGAILYSSKREAKPVPERVYTAADEFDERHKKYLSLAQRCARPHILMPALPTHY